MARWQRVEKQLAREAAAAAVGVLATDSPITVNQKLGNRAQSLIARLATGELGLSSEMEIVNPSSGRFWQEPGISWPGGTDDLR